MNIILFKSSELIDKHIVTISDMRVIEHVRTVLKSHPGDTVKVGEVNGRKGTGVIKDFTPDRLILQVTLSSPPPRALPCTLILAMPRPKAFKRTIQAAVTLGIKTIYIIKTWRVDKNYFESPVLLPENIDRQVILGLEQAGDTILPHIEVRQYFKPFFEDELPSLCRGKELYIAHPYSDARVPSSVQKECLLAIGPEGGFIEYEVNRFIDSGFSPVTIGDRILRVEQAIPAFLSRMFYF